MQKKKKTTNRPEATKEITPGCLVQFTSPGQYMCSDSLEGPITITVESGDIGLVLNHRTKEAWKNFVFEAASEVLLGSLIINDVPNDDLKIVRQNV